MKNKLFGNGADCIIFKLLIFALKFQVTVMSIHDNGVHVPNQIEKSVAESLKLIIEI